MILMTNFHEDLHVFLHTWTFTSPLCVLASSHTCFAHTHAFASMFCRHVHFLLHSTIA